MSLINLIIKMRLLNNSHNELNGDKIINLAIIDH